jgi:hypothetical protein
MVTACPFEPGPFEPEYRVPAIVTQSQPDSVENSVELTTMFDNAVTVHRSLSP